jgi:hypothetical protein
MTIDCPCDRDNHGGIALISIMRMAALAPRPFEERQSYGGMGILAPPTGETGETGERVE